MAAIGARLPDAAGATPAVTTEENAFARFVTNLFAGANTSSHSKTAESLEEGFNTTSSHTYIATDPNSAMRAILDASNTAVNPGFYHSLGLGSTMGCITGLIRSKDGMAAYNDAVKNRDAIGAIDAMSVLLMSGLEVSSGASAAVTRGGNIIAAIPSCSGAVVKTAQAVAQAAMPVFLGMSSALLGVMSVRSMFYGASAQAFANEMNAADEAIADGVVDTHFSFLRLIDGIETKDPAKLTAAQQENLEKYRDLKRIIGAAGVATIKKMVEDKEKKIGSPPPTALEILAAARKMAQQSAIEQFGVGIVCALYVIGLVVILAKGDSDAINALLAGGAVLMGIVDGYFYVKEDRKSTKKDNILQAIINLILVGSAISALCFSNNALMKGLSSAMIAFYVIQSGISFYRFNKASAVESAREGIMPGSAV